MQIHHYGARRVWPSQGLRLANNESSSFQMSRCFENMLRPRATFLWGHCPCKRKVVLVGEAAYLNLLQFVGKVDPRRARLISGTMALITPPVMSQSATTRLDGFGAWLTGQVKWPADG